MLAARATSKKSARSLAICKCAFVYTHRVEVCCVHMWTRRRVLWWVSAQLSGAHLNVSRINYTSAHIRFRPRAATAFTARQKSACAMYMYKNARYTPVLLRFGCTGRSAFGCHEVFVQPTEACDHWSKRTRAKGHQRWRRRRRRRRIKTRDTNSRFFIRKNTYFLYSKHAWWFWFLYTTHNFTNTFTYSNVSSITPLLFSDARHVSGDTFHNICWCQQNLAVCLVFSVFMFSFPNLYLLIYILCIV